MEAIPSTSGPIHGICCIPNTLKDRGDGNDPSLTYRLFHFVCMINREKDQYLLAFDVTRRNPSSVPFLFHRQLCDLINTHQQWISGLLESVSQTKKKKKYNPWPAQHINTPNTLSLRPALSHSGTYNLCHLAKRQRKQKVVYLPPQKRPLKRCSVFLCVYSWGWRCCAPLS